jgi:hypothetical protein
MLETVKLANGVEYQFSPLPFWDGIEVLNAVDKVSDGDMAAIELVRSKMRESLLVTHSPEETEKALRAVALGDTFNAVVRAITFRGDVVG